MYPYQTQGDLVVTSIENHRIIFSRERNNNKVSQKVEFFQKSITLDPVDRSERFSPFCDPEVMGVNPVSDLK